ncbi:MFS transporter [Demequina pelophila]|uniref:MFS transporter n=1 Tax=Demequina pelophila TaxID=1638984 RepID=UPI0007857BCF|nr:MFS transporter [Demequina pelophila]
MVTRERAARGAWIVLAAAVGAYFVAVVNRTALGIAGVEALDRFGTDSVGLALLSVTQIAAYAALQIPAGRMIDRFGPKAVMATGLAVMALGQALMAFTPSLAIALIARVLIGAGDGPIFIGVTGLIARWFPARQVPVLVQVTGLVGQAGQLASAIPVAALLHRAGWSTTFSVLAAATVVVGLMAALRIRNPEDAADEPDRQRLWASIGQAVRPAGTRLGFWSHFLAQFAPNTLALLWGVPFFVQGQGRTPGEASLLITLLTVAAMAGGPLAGMFTARHPLRRSWLVLGTAGAIALAWIWVLVHDTPRPLWQLAIFAMVTGLGTPVSLVGMDFARTFAPVARLGTASGFVNIGGFAATIASVALVGLVLRLVAPGGAGDYTLAEYRLALAALALPWLVGVAGVIRNRRSVRADLAAQGVEVPLLRDTLRGRGGAK